MEPERRVAIIVDNPVRDLAGLVLLAVALADRGALCHLVPMHLQAAELRALAPDVVVLNYLRPTNEALARQLINADVAVIVLDTEGGVLPSTDAYGATLSSDDALRMEVAAWCGWGPVLADHAIRSQWFSTEQVIVTGAPRFDLYAEPWRSAARRLAEQVTPAAVQGPHVMINTNFPLINPRFSTLEAEGSMLVRDFGWTAERLAEAQTTQRASMEGMVSLARDLARSTAAHVIFRPHPFEDATPYRSLLAGTPNLHLIREGGVDGWILGAAAVIQRSCTTAIEAAMSGVPALSPQWVPAAVQMQAAERVSIPATSQEELDEQVHLALMGSLQPPDAIRSALDDTVRDWFHAIDGRSHDRVAEVVLTRSQHHEREGHIRRCRSIGDTAGATARLKLLAKRHLPPELRKLRPGPAEARWRSSQKAFDQRDVQRILDALSQVAPHAGFLECGVAGPDDQGTRLRHGRAVRVSRRNKG